MDIDRSFRLGGPRDHVLVRAIELVEDEDDPMMWVPSQITIVAGAFSGSFDATLQRRDFFEFRAALRPLFERLVGEASFDTIEGQLAIELSGDGKGHFAALVTARPLTSIGTQLIADITFDQTELGPTLRELDALCESLIRA